MNSNNINLIRATVKEAGNYLQEKLPPHPGHVKRNAYAHIWLAIKEQMGQSYKDCDDSDLEKILNIIQNLKDNPA